MMGWTLADAERATWWQYQATLWNHNDRHTPNDEAPTVDPEMIAYMKRQDEMIQKRGWGRSIH